MAFTPEEELALKIIAAQGEKTISQLDSAVTVVGDMLLPIEDGVGTFAASVDDIADYTINQIGPATATTIGVSYLGSPPTFGFSSTTAITVTPGTFNFSDGSGQAVNSFSGTKTMSAFATGSGNGSLDTGSVGNNLWYFVYSIYNPTNGATDYLTSLSPTSPTLPAGFTKFKRLKGFFKTNGSAAIIPFNLSNGVWVNATTVTAEQNLVTQTSQAGSAGTVTNAFPAVANIATVEFEMLVTGAGASSFNVWGNLQSTPVTGLISNSGLRSSALATNNGFVTSGTGLVYNNNGTLSFQNFDVAGGVSAIKVALLSIQDITN